MLAPAGSRIAFTGGTDCNDHTRIWETLDKIRAKHSDMVLLHGGNPRGAERSAACWADRRKVAQVVFKVLGLPGFGEIPGRVVVRAHDAVVPAHRSERSTIGNRDRRELRTGGKG